eukprot:10839688-Alexandrium_andersonii.AAC.1
MARAPRARQENGCSSCCSFMLLPRSVGFGSTAASLRTRGAAAPAAARLFTALTESAPTVTLAAELLGSSFCSVPLPWPCSCTSLYRSASRAPRRAVRPLPAA